ncbi:MAG: hypothetical protein PUC00_12950 [Clostridiales bacterium]|nr:hypothetical protein [Clostridiales bacterium]
MKNRFSTILTWALVLVLIAGAFGIGAVKGYRDEREKLLLSCMEMHTQPNVNLARSIERCESDAADFDARLQSKLRGRMAAAFGVEPVSESVASLHAQLLRQSTVQPTPDLAAQLGEKINELLEDNVDTKLSLSKVFWTLVCLFTIFGKRGRRKGFTFSKLLAGFGLFKMWKKN